MQVRAHFEPVLPGKLIMLVGLYELDDARRVDWRVGHELQQRARLGGVDASDAERLAKQTQAMRIEQCLCRRGQCTETVYELLVHRIELVHAVAICKTLV